MDFAESRIEGARELRWVAGQGQARFERSSFGAMLARADLYGHAYVRHDDDGALVATRIKWRGRELDARPAGSRQRAEVVLATEGFEQDVETFGRVITVMRAVRDINPLFEHALWAIHGDRGARLAWLGGSLGERSARAAPGDLLALYWLVPSGVELIRDAMRALALEAEAARLRAAKRAKHSRRPADVVAEPEEVVADPWEHFAPWEYRDPVSGAVTATKRPRTVRRPVEGEHASATPSMLQLANEMLRPVTEARQALQVAAECEASELRAQATAAWDACYWRAINRAAAEVGG